MTTIQVKLRTSSVQHKEGTLYYIVTHSRVTKWISTDYKIYPHEWDEHNGHLSRFDQHFGGRPSQ